MGCGLGVGVETGTGDEVGVETGTGDDVGVGVAAGTTPNSGACVGEGAGAGVGSPQATPVVTASARTPMTKYLFNPLPRGRELRMPRGRRCTREQIVSFY